MYTEDRANLIAKTLSKLDGLIIYANIGKITSEREKAMLDYVAEGGGLFHCTASRIAFSTARSTSNWPARNSGATGRVRFA